jgi:ribonuclease BN (tRNA processing enzyme)
MRLLSRYVHVRFVIPGDRSRSMSIVHVRSAALLLGLLGFQTARPTLAQQQSPKPTASKTRIVLLGTGTPAPLPERSGPATAIVVNETAYLVDFGPGIVRRASAAVRERGIKALEVTKLRVAYVTHLHSDHTVGYPDLIFTPWTIGRRFPLEVYGPKGVKAMTEHLLEAYRVDIETRTNPDGNQRTFVEGHRVNAHEIRGGVVYKDSNVTVTAFPTKHAMESYGYRFDTPDRSIVISGDTHPTQATIDACRGCDVLIHEAHMPGGSLLGPRHSSASPPSIIRPHPSWPSSPQRRNRGCSSSITMLICLKRSCWKRCCACIRATSSWVETSMFIRAPRVYSHVAARPGTQLPPRRTPSRTPATMRAPLDWR